MLGYLLRKIGYGLLVLFGVVTLVFFIFNLSPGDPARQIAGQNDSEEVLENIRLQLGLNLPWYEQYALYINDLSPLSVHAVGAESKPHSWSETKYTGSLIWEGDQRALAIKRPYLRRSYKSNRLIGDIIADALPGTIILAITAISIALALGLLLGVVSAVYKDSWLDRLILVLAVLGMSGPSFFIAIIVAWIGGYLWYETGSLPMFPLLLPLLFLSGRWLWEKAKSAKQKSWAKWGVYGLLIGLGYWILGMFWPHFPMSQAQITFPGTGLNMTGSLYSVDVWKGEYLSLKNLILPAITLGIRPLAVIVQLTRNSLLDVMSQDYIRTARAKGLSEYQIIWKHAMRNALNPVVTAVSGWFASLLAGAVFVEFVFGWKGLGLEIFTALEKEDQPVVMGAVLVIAALFVFINILVDFIYGWIDPRVRVG